MPGQLAGRPPVHQSLYLWSKAVLPNYVLTVLGDRMEMAHSVEGRVPFLDHHVVELVRSLPVTQKIRGTTEKYVLREATRSVLTETVYGRHKHPFTSPPAALAPEQRLHALLQDTLRGPALKAMPFFDQRKVVALLDSLPATGRCCADRHRPRADDHAERVRAAGALRAELIRDGRRAHGWWGEGNRLPLLAPRPSVLLHATDVPGSPARFAGQR